MEALNINRADARRRPYFDGVFEELRGIQLDYKNSHSVRIFLSYYRPHIKLFLLDMLCALIICIIDLAFPYVSKLSMQELIPKSMFHAFFMIMIICAVAYIGKGLLYYFITYWGHVFGVRVESDIRRDVFAHIQTLDCGFFDKNRTGALMSRITNDLFEITELAHHGPEDLFISCVTLIGAFCIMCSIEWRLAVVVFAIVPIFVVFTCLQRRHMARVNRKVKERLADINVTIESGISGMRTAKAFNNERSEYDKFSRTSGEFVQAKSNYYKAMAVFHGGMEFAMSIMSVVAIAAGGYFIMRDTMDYADLVAFTLYVTTFITPIRKLSAFVEQFLQGMAGFSRFLALMRTEPEIRDDQNAVDIGRVHGNIIFENVSFQYDEGDVVLKNVNLQIKSGERLAVVGPSGSGKTTLCQLIPRFYDVTHGSVLVDGYDVRSVRQQALRENIGIVQQDVFLFADSILENIRYGRPDATDEEVVTAAHYAEIHEDIMMMPNGYDTYVGERGVLLSGGQKQRISIARIFLKNPPIVILDEATSALDSVTEAKIHASFEKLCRGRTAVIIAHRLSTVRNADKIVVIDHKGIAETGTHSELMKKGGEYAELVNAQQSL